LHAECASRDTAHIGGAKKEYTLIQILCEMQVVCSVITTHFERDERSILGILDFLRSRMIMELSQLI
jgi:hypothetical protein